MDGEVAERAGRSLFKTLEAAGGLLEQLSAAYEAVSAYHGNNYLPLLARFYRSHRPASFTLVDALEMEPTTADCSVLDAVEFIRANRDRRGRIRPFDEPVCVAAGSCAALTPRRRTGRGQTAHLQHPGGSRHRRAPLRVVSIYPPS